MYSDGFKYWLAYKKHNISYYRCSRYKTKCPGRCVMEDGIIRNTTTHNHQPDPDRVLVEKFRKSLTHRASKETTDLYTIYWDEASQRHSDAAMLYTFAAAESAMRKARRKQLPPVPNTMQELGNVLLHSNLFRIHSGQNKDQFYQTTLVLDEATCLIFAHIKTLAKIGRVEEMHLDASIEVTPALQLNYYLLTVHSVQSYYNIPILFVVMTAKSQTIYAAVFAYIREHFSSYISPSIVMTNFQADIQTAISFTFPEATIKGYWFHYTDAIRKYVKHLDLAGETARGHGSSCLRMLMVLPLLPADYMAPGMQAVRKWAEEKKILSSSMNTLCTYIEQHWLRAIGADKMSMFGLPHSIYNHIQAFNKDLRTQLGTAHPTIWVMLESITYMATRTFVKVNKRLKLTKTTELNKEFQPKKCQQVSGAIINDATQLWIRTPVHLRSPLHFLQLSSHCINDTIYYANLDDLTNSKKSDAINTLPLPMLSAGGPAIATIHKPHTISYSSIASTEGQQFQIIAPTNTINASKCPTTVQYHNIQDASNPNIIYEYTFAPNTAMMNMPPSGIIQRQPQNRDPPPLAYFPKVKVNPHNVVYSSSEPPPLVPIRQRLDLSLRKGLS